MKKYNVIIGIDCDVQKSGVAYLEVATRRLEPYAMTFPELLEYLQDIALDSDVKGYSVIIVVEAGWLNKISNYHTAASRGGQRISKNVGANHEVGKKIIEMCRHYGLEVVEQKPLRKIWKKGKISMEELNTLLLSKKMGALDKTVGQDCRDAILLVLYKSNIL